MFDTIWPSFCKEENPEVVEREEFTKHLEQQGGLQHFEIGNFQVQKRAGTKPQKWKFEAEWVECLNPTPLLEGSVQESNYEEWN